MRELLKGLAVLLAAIAVLPATASFRLRSIILGRDRALEGSTQALALVPGLLGNYLRRAFLRNALAGCGPNSVVSFGTIFSKAGARIDARAYVGPGCYIGLVHIEHDVLIGSGVHITSGRHIHGSGDVTRPIREQEGRATLVRIGAGAWIGSAAVIMADVGANTIVAAGAVVVEPIPESVIAAGVPARVVRGRV